jgi:hypothetical protein
MGGQRSVQMVFWFRKTVLPTVFDASIIGLRSAAAPHQRLEFLPPMSASLMPLEFVCSAAEGADGSAHPPFGRSPLWSRLCLSPARSREHQTLSDSLTPTQHPKWFYTFLLRLCWSQHNGKQHALTYSNSCLCKRSDLLAWYSRSLGVHIFLPVLSGETSLLHYQHTVCSLFHPLLSTRFFTQHREFLRLRCG